VPIWVVHHGEPVDHGQDLLLVVRDHDGCQKLALQLANFEPHFLAQFNVEVR
jgi:hypothetical protein